MPNHTVNFGLPYPASTDEPCDFAEQWCDFTAAIDSVFGVFQSAIDRTIPIVPVAIVQQTIPRSVFNFSPVPFDTVLIDTAGMTDFDTDPYTITIKRPGRYTVAAGMHKASTGAPPAPLQYSIFASPTFSAQAIVNDLGAGGGITYYLASYFAVETYAAGDQIRIGFSVGFAGFQTISDSRLAVAWHSDTEVP